MIRSIRRSLTGQDAAGRREKETAKMVSKFERDMNPEQVAAIRHGAGPCALLAQAGSGKTRALVHRIGRLVEEGGVHPHEVLAVTFSKKAADEMNQRLTILGVHEARVGTWHSLCLEILRDDHTEWEDWAVDEKDAAKSIVKEVVGYKHMNWKTADATLLRRFIGFAKANLAAPGSPEAFELAGGFFQRHEVRLAAEAYETTQHLIEERAILTFDDFLVFTHRHLEDEENRQRWAGRWSYMLQDEAQDMNAAQRAIARQLAGDHQNYMVVGDVAQAIYGFRGSKPEYLAAFESEWPGAQVIYMNRNYRSGGAIVAAANKVIGPAAIRLPVDMLAERAEPGLVRVLSSANLDAEADEFASWCGKLIADGESPSTICALFRVNAQSRALEEALLGARIPYVVVGGTSFYERKEVRDLLGYLRVAAGTEAVDTDALRRSINAPFRFLGKAFVQRVMDLVEGGAAEGMNWQAVVGDVAQQAGIQARQKASAFEWVKLIDGVKDDIARGRTAAQVINDLITRTAYIPWLEKEEGQESIESNQAANVRELARVAERFPTVAELLGYIDETVFAAKRQRRDGQAGGERVLLMSIHRSKGLEWPRVFVGGLNESVLPHAKGDAEEERRLAYVAVTRARDELVLSHVTEMATRAGIKRAEPSRYLADMGF